MSLLDERIDHRFGVLAYYAHEHEVARLALHQNGDLAVVAAEVQVTFPMTRYGPVFGLCWTLADRYRLGDPATVGGFLRVIASGASRGCAAGAATAFSSGLRAPG